MLKTKFIAAALLGALTTSAMAAPTSGFMRGPSIAVVGGYQMNSVSGTSIQNSPTAGLAFDYNFPVSGTLFGGFGLEATYAFTKAKKNVTRLQRNFTGTALGRLGVVSGTVAFEGNLGVVVTSWNLKGPRPSNITKTSNTVVGVAPGVGLTFAVAKNVNLGMHYRFEYYPTKSSGVKNLNGHNIFAKLSYNF